MGTVNSSTEQEQDESILSRSWDLILEVLLAIRGSFLLFVAAVGALLIVAGAFAMNGVLAGMFGIWGASALLYAGLGYLLLKLVGYQ
ncbi:hypothetical protein [Halorussus salinisoli]|uniref:hypothetical protein n=1 Tax=Halorussus salinisoli TaxID=2558242 RepID=UPI002A91F87B|nr:hypothetical protein [Halorussus salinisoli]